MAALVLYPFLRKHCSSRNVNSVALVCFALVFIGVGLSGTTSYWTQWTLPSKIVTSSHHSGLWKSCKDGHCASARDNPGGFGFMTLNRRTVGNCIDFSLAAWLYAVRAFAVASAVLSLPVLLLLAVHCVKAPGRSLRTSAEILDVQGEIFCIFAFFVRVHLRFYSSFLYHRLGCLCCRGTIRKGRFTRILLHPRLAEAAIFLCVNRRLSRGGSYDQLA